MNPIRPQDYEALAEENRRLTEELAKGKIKKEPKLKKKREPTKLFSYFGKAWDWWWDLDRNGSPLPILVMVFGSIGLLGLFLFFFIEHFDKPLRENASSPIVCYQLYQDPEKPIWSEWNLWGLRTRNFRKFHFLDKSFATKDAGEAFVKQYNLKVCP